MMYLKSASKIWYSWTVLLKKLLTLQLQNATFLRLNKFVFLRNTSSSQVWELIPPPPPSFYVITLHGNGCGDGRVCIDRWKLYIQHIILYEHLNEVTHNFFHKKLQKMETMASFFILINFRLDSGVFCSMNWHFLH